MSFKIRPAKPDEMDEFNRVAADALLFPIDPADEPFKKHEQTLCAFQDGVLVTTYAAFDLNININGGTVPTAGVSFVGTNPIYRRLGSLRKVTARHFEILHEEKKQPVSALYASHAAIYRRYGYTPVVALCSYRVEPRFIQFINDSHSAGHFRASGETEKQIFVDLYDEFIQKRTGYLKRSEYNWNQRFKPAKNLHRKKCFLLYEEAGKPTGYLLFTEQLHTDDSDESDKSMIINDIVWNTYAAYRAVWEFFSNMDAVKHVVWAHVPDDDPLPQLLLEPRELHKKTGDGLLSRIVDVERAMDKRGYDEEGILIFRILDDFCPWNEGTWKLEVSSDGSTVKRTDETPQITMPVSTLSLLFFNYYNATRISHMGLLDVHDHTSLKLWNRVMDTEYAPVCADDF